MKKALATGLVLSLFSPSLAENPQIKSFVRSTLLEESNKPVNPDIEKLVQWIKAGKDSTRVLWDSYYPYDRFQREVRLDGEDLTFSYSDRDAPMFNLMNSPDGKINSYDILELNVHSPQNEYLFTDYSLNGIKNKADYMERYQGSKKLPFPGTSDKYTNANQQYLKRIRKVNKNFNPQKQPSKN